MQQFIIDTSGELFWIVTMNTAGHVLPSTRVYRFLLEISSIGGGIVGNPFLEADDPHEIPTWIGDEFYGLGVLVALVPLARRLLCSALSSTRILWLVGAVLVLCCAGLRERVLLLHTWSAHH